MRVALHSRFTPLALGAISVLAAACGGPGRDSGSASGTMSGAIRRCRATVDQAVGVAVSDYIRQAKPKPERFLVAAGTDSALGDAGLTALQDKGPTYLYPGDPAQQSQVRTQLHEKGDYTTLLVVRKSADKQGGSATVLLNGHYVGGEEEGKSVGPRRYTFACDTSGWHIKTTSAEHSA